MLIQYDMSDHIDIIQLVCGQIIGLGGRPSIEDGEA